MMCATQHKNNVKWKVKREEKEIMEEVVDKSSIESLPMQPIMWTLSFCFRCLTSNPSCIEAKRMLALHLLAREGAYDRAAVNIGEIIQLLDRLEPKNHFLFWDMSLAYARMVSQSVWECCLFLW